jgi:hypothetical protein
VRYSVRSMLEAVKGRLCLLEVLVVPEVICCVLLCMLEAVEGGFCLLEMLEVLVRESCASASGR